MTSTSKLLRHSGIYTIGIILNRIVSFIMLPIYTRYLSTADYGTMELIEITLDLVTVFAGMGLIQGLNKFYSCYETEQEKNALVSTLFISLIFIFTLVSLLGASASDLLSSIIFKSNNYSYFILLGFISLPVSFLVFIPLSFIQVQQKPTLYVVVSTIKLVLQLALNIFFVVILKKGIAGVLYSTLISTASLGLYLSVYTFRSVSFHYSSDIAARLLRFGYPFIFAGLGSFVLTYIDRYFLNYFCNADTVGIYSLGYKFGFLLLMFPVRPFFNTWMVERFEVVKVPGYDKAFSNALRGFTLLTMIVVTLISVGVHTLIRFISAGSFWQAAEIVPIILLSYYFQACTEFFNFGIVHSGKTKHMAIGTLLAALINVLLCIVWIPHYHIYGAAWATFFAFLARLSYVYIASQASFRIKFNFNNAYGIHVLSIGIIILHLIITKSSSTFTGNFSSMLLSSFTVMLYVICLFIFKVIDPHEKRKLFSVLGIKDRALTPMRSAGD